MTIYYVEKELICHYMTVPLLITMAGALIGNLLGAGTYVLVAAKEFQKIKKIPMEQALKNIV